MRRIERLYYAGAKQGFTMLPFMQRIMVVVASVLLVGCNFKPPAKTPVVPTPITATGPTMVRQPSDAPASPVPTSQRVDIITPTVFPSLTLTGSGSSIEPTPTLDLELTNRDESYAITLNKPILVDGEHGLLVAAGLINIVPKTLVLSTVDGRLLASFEPVGQLALDRSHGRLIIDDGRTGLTILDIQTGETLGAFALPEQEEVPPPQVDPDSGLIYAFRNNNVYLVDPAGVAVEDTISLSVDISVCGEVRGRAKILRSEYDLVHKRLYLTFMTYVCTPWTSVTIVNYDATSMTPAGQFDTSASYQAVSFQGSLFGTTSPHMGTNHYWAWNSGEPWFSNGGEDNHALRGIVADWGRGLIYEGVGEEIRIIDAGTRQVISWTPVDLLANGYLVGHDPITDQLYFLVGSGRLAIWNASNLFDRAGSPRPVPSTLPARPVIALALSPGWPGDQTLMGIWQVSDCPAAGGEIFIRRGQNGDWERSFLTGKECDGVASAVFSPDFPQDRTLFAASNSLNTVLKSPDGGLTWQPAGNGLPAGVQFQALFVSSAYGQDKTLFAHAANGNVYKTQDDGQSWQALNINLDRLAVSLEFGRDDHSLMGASGTILFFSDDGGNSWTELGSTPGNEPLVMLSMAPLFTKWQAAFAFTSGGGFYRSLDAGKSWEQQIGTSAGEQVQIAYAPDMEENRPIFLLHGAAIESSFDGWNSTWITEIDFQSQPAGISAIAISPDFRNDGLLFVGTQDGQIITGKVALPVLSE
ncbi:MAG: hypothetical protein JXA42_20465 [Anaerolineales bacterium]|nr:hypothetical protein [Anaerolineales bacterium]